MKAIEASNCIDGWLKASQYLIERPGRRAYSVVIEVENPLSLPPEDRVVYDIVDDFLRSKDGMPLSTVVNTVFPAQLYKKHGAPGVYERYPALFPTIQCHADARNWGTYAMRMIQRVDHEGRTIYPLRETVAKIARQAKLVGAKRAAYEVGTVDPFTDIPIYEPGRDRASIMGGPCLSHVSFKLMDNRALMLTGFYRSHFYVERALGNLLGLAHLQNFVAEQAAIPLGPLVCHSSMAQLDTAAGRWNAGDVRDLVERCTSTRASSSAANGASSATKVSRRPGTRPR